MSDSEEQQPETKPTVVEPAQVTVAVATKTTEQSIDEIEKKQTNNTTTASPNKNNSNSSNKKPRKRRNRNRNKNRQQKNKKSQQQKQQQLQKLHQQQSKSPNKKAKPKPKSKSSAIKIPKNQDEIIEMSSESSDSDSSSSSDTEDTDSNRNSNKQKNRKNNKQQSNKMETYDTRNKTDNQILFGANTNSAQVENEPMSGLIPLQHFPLGNTQDCTNLAQQLIRMFKFKKNKEEISSSDVCAFLKILLKSEILEELELKHSEQIEKQITELLLNKQKYFRRGKKKRGNQHLHRLGKNFALSREGRAKVLGSLDH